MATKEARTGARPSAPARPARPSALPQGPGYALKRAILGPALATARLKHERLGKPTALAVFASDNLSSSAYATEEILKVAVPAVGGAAFALVMPITFAILAVLAILLFSYRQTIKAYPSAGGAYIVTRDNFGLLPAQVAGVALLTDYVLTVSVSVAAGIAAITSAAGTLYPYRVWMSVFCIWFIAWGNLRGVRESGRMFAVPTYFFILMMFVLLGVGMYRALAGDLHPLAVPDDALRTSGAVSLFLILHAFASGGAAVTGVEAVSNGIPAFKPPEWKNARTTLMWMGTLLGIMFLGLSYLAVQLRVVPTETRTLNSQVARAVFGGGAVGFALFLMIQIATTLILILAANTSFADFPRLANFHATDNFMPRQLTKRGHRLVFSNGIVGLAVASTLLVVLFQADVHRLIPLYAIGVFTSFTLSQAGMARRHLRIKEPSWRLGLAINGFGAVTTAVVTVIIAVTKFQHGAWAVMVFVPVTVWLLVRLNRQYEREHEELDEDLPVFDVSGVRRPIAVLLVEDLGRETVHALQYLKTIRAEQTHAIYFARDKRSTKALQAGWDDLGIDVPLKVVSTKGDLAMSLARYVKSLPGDADVNVIIPGPASIGFVERLRSSRMGAQLAKALLPLERARITVVRDHMGPGHPITEAIGGRHRLRVLPRPSHRAVVLVDKVDRASLEAVRYALGLGPTEVRAVHAAVDLENQEQLMRLWMELRIPVELDVIECWDRNVARSLERYVVDLMGRDSEVTVVLPRRDYARLRHRLLHDRTSRKIARALGRYEHVDLAVVPYYFGKQRSLGAEGRLT
ncbi:MAG TPA: APC family permease [Actinomycetota bacterium]|jgi:amino acid transporter